MLDDLEQPGCHLDGHHDGGVHKSVIIGDIVQYLTLVLKRNCPSWTMSGGKPLPETSVSPLTLLIHVVIQQFGTYLADFLDRFRSLCRAA